MPKVCSELLSTVYEGRLWGPPSKPLPCTMESSFHLSLWPDKALTLTENLMSPYSGRGLSHKQKIFHYRLSHARRVLLSCIQLYVENVFKMELVCCVLHIAVYSIMYYMIRREAPLNLLHQTLLRMSSLWTYVSLLGSRALEINSQTSLFHLRMKCPGRPECHQLKSES